MAYSEDLAKQIRKVTANFEHVIEKKMFGGLCFLLKGNMWCGIVGAELMLRIGKERYEEALKKTHVKKMDFTGKAMKGMIYISATGLGTQKEIKKWLLYAHKFVDDLPEK